MSKVDFHLTVGVHLRTGFTRTFSANQNLPHLLGEKPTANCRRNVSLA